MLKEKPAIAGIAAPGMPMGSPGMEQGGAKEAYDVIAFTKDGKTDRLREAQVECAAGSRTALPDPA